jgi:hypothetical protein
VHFALEIAVKEKFMKMLNQIALSHFSPTRLKEVRGVVPGEGSEMFWGEDQLTKPRGLWVSVDGKNDWAEFIRSGRHAKMLGAYQHQVILENSAPILMVETVSDAVEVFESYRTGTRDRLCDKIDWARLGSEWSGILISNYYWYYIEAVYHDRLLHTEYQELRDELQWTQRWDVASGCIWDARAIASIEVIEETALAA